VGLTGGIGSGKSTVAKLLAQWGATVLDADQISRNMTQAQGEAISAIQDAFGADLITPEGALNREKMRSLVFSDPQAKLQLESILHPRVESALLRLAQEATLQGQALIVLDIPLLAESKRWLERLDRILVMDCSEDTQVERVMQRSQLSPEQIMNIIRSQSSRQNRLALADWVILNDHVSLLELEQKTRVVFEEALALAKGNCSDKLI
jgi:dephospho-CoA kinase